MTDSGRFTAAERAARSPEAVARTFHLFARNEAPQLDSPLYAELCYGVSQDPELLRIAQQTPAEQPPPNMLLAAVQYLLLRSAERLLRLRPDLAEATFIGMLHGLSGVMGKRR